MIPPSPRLVVDFEPGRAGVQADVGHRAPQRAEGGLGFAQGAVDGGAVAHVPGEGPDPVGAVPVREPRACRVERFGPPGGEGDPRAFGKTRLDDAEADPPAAAGDENDLAAQTQIHLSLLEP